MFAGDVKLISARANFDDLQRHLQIAWDWALAWDLHLTEHRCGEISIGAAPMRPLTLSQNCYSIYLLDTTKELGVAIDSAFVPSIHSAQAFKKARSALFFIRRSFVSLTPEIFIPRCTTQVRPHLENASQP